MLEGGATHVGVATDHVIESWRNGAWPAYKSSAGVPPDLLAQFGPFEDALRSMGLVVWAMTDLEADDALASAAAVISEDPRASQILICTPDKDLGQCVRDNHVVCYDRRKEAVVDEDAVRARFGVGPGSVPDWLALVGDSADGFPGLAGWGAKAASAVLGHYGSIEAIPLGPGTWPVGLPASRASALKAVLVQDYELAQLFKRLATCVVQRDLLPSGTAAVDSLTWRGPKADFGETCDRLEAPALLGRAENLASKRLRAG